jgi:hypothetical protein
MNPQLWMKVDTFPEIGRIYNICELKASLNIYIYCKLSICSEGRTTIDITTLIRVALSSHLCFCIKVLLCHPIDFSCFNDMATSLFLRL